MSVKDELKAMAEGFRWGRRPLVPRSAEEHAKPKVDRVFPSDWARTDAGVAVRQALLKGAMTPDRPERAHAAGLRTRQPRGHRTARDLLLEPLEPPGRHADHVHAPGRLAGEDRGRRGARLLLRRVVAAGVHRARLRRVPDRPRARREGRGRQGTRAPLGGVEHRRVPRGHALGRRSPPAVPPRRRAARPRDRRRPRADRDRRGVPGDAEGAVLAPSGPATRHRALRGAVLAAARGRRIKTSLGG